MSWVMSPPCHESCLLHVMSHVSSMSWVMSPICHESCLQYVMPTQKRQESRHIPQALWKASSSQETGRDVRRSNPNPPFRYIFATFHRLSSYTPAQKKTRKKENEYRNGVTEHALSAYRHSIRGRHQRHVRDRNQRYVRDRHQRHVRDSFAKCQLFGVWCCGCTIPYGHAIRYLVAMPYDTLTPCHTLPRTSYLVLVLHATPCRRYTLPYLHATPYRRYVLPYLYATPYHTASWSMPTPHKGLCNDAVAYDDRWCNGAVAYDDLICMPYLIVYACYTSSYLHATPYLDACHTLHCGM